MDATCVTEDRVILIDLEDPEEAEVISPVAHQQDPLAHELAQNTAPTDIDKASEEATNTTEDGLENLGVCVNVQDPQETAQSPPDPPKNLQEALDSSEAPHVEQDLLDFPDLEITIIEPQLNPPTPATPQSNRKRAIQQRLALLLHAQHCDITQELTSEVLIECIQPNCSTIKHLLHHLSKCKIAHNCHVDRCSSSKMILKHWKNCTCPQCPLCAPLRCKFQKIQNPENGGKFENSKNRDESARRVSLGKNPMFRGSRQIVTPPKDLVDSQILRNPFASARKKGGKQQLDTWDDDEPELLNRVPGLPKNHGVRRKFDWVAGSGRSNWRSGESGIRGGRRGYQVRGFRHARYSDRVYDDGRLGGDSRSDNNFRSGEHGERPDDCFRLVESGERPEGDFGSVENREQLENRFGVMESGADDFRSMENGPGSNFRGRSSGAGLRGYSRYGANARWGNFRGSGGVLQNNGRSRGHGDKLRGDIGRRSIGDYLKGKFANRGYRGAVRGKLRSRGHRGVLHNIRSRENGSSLQNNFRSVGRGVPQSNFNSNAGEIQQSTAIAELVQKDGIIEIQEQMLKLVHTFRCRREAVPCDDPICRNTRNLLEHLKSCQRTISCWIPRCISSKKILIHVNECRNRECNVCAPLEGQRVDC